nr:immunoglobulin heavy chain junction region [Mus musculus]
CARSYGSSYVDYW